MDKIAIIIGISIIIVLVSIFITPKFFLISSPETLNMDNATITKAFNDGIIVSMVQLLDSTDQCKIASIQYFNTTRRLVDLECIIILLEQQNITLGG